MEIKKLNFEKKEVQIKETYIDETGKTRERIKKIMMPTGNVVSNDDDCYPTQYTQCVSCKFNEVEKALYCIKYPNGKPENVIKGISRCEHLSY